MRSEGGKINVGGFLRKGFGFWDVVVDNVLIDGIG